MKVILYGFGAMGQKIYHQIKKQGDEVEFRGERHTVLEIKDNWIFNKIVNITILVK